METCFNVPKEFWSSLFFPFHPVKEHNLHYLVFVANINVIYLIFDVNIFYLDFIDPDY